jgi:hypothetical protein
MQKRREHPTLKIFSVVISLISIYQLFFILTKLAELRFELRGLQFSATARSKETDEKWNNYLLMKSVPSCEYFFSEIKILLIDTN